MLMLPPRSTLFPYTTLFRSRRTDLRRPRAHPRGRPVRQGAGNVRTRLPPAPREPAREDDVPIHVHGRRPRTAAGDLYGVRRRLRHVQQRDDAPGRDPLREKSTGGVSRSTRRLRAWVTRPAAFGSHPVERDRFTNDNATETYV